MPDVAGPDATPPAVPEQRRPTRVAGWLGVDLPHRFFWFAAAAAASTTGLVTFGLISYHASRVGLIPVAAVPVLYAALASGHLYDRWGGRVLYALPVLAVAIPALALSRSGVGLVVGALLWGAAVGVQESTVKALVADLVVAPRRATAYGVFAAVQGVAALAGGALYNHSLTLLVILLGACQIAGAALLAVALTRPWTPGGTFPGSQATVGGRSRSRYGSEPHRPGPRRAPSRRPLHPVCQDQWESPGDSSSVVGGRGFSSVAGGRGGLG